MIASELAYYDFWLALFVVAIAVAVYLILSRVFKV